MFLVMVLVLLISTVVTILTLFYISEKVNFERNAHKSMETLYKKDSQFEIAKNLNLQYLDQLSYEDLEDIVWSGDDSSDLESLLENNVYNKLYGNYEVRINTLNDVYIKDLCFELVVEIDGELDFIGYECEEDAIELNFDLTLTEIGKNKSKSVSFEYVIGDVFLEVSEDGSTIFLNLDDVYTKVMNLEG